MGGARESLASAIDAHGAWYHTIELAPGLVTPGQVDLRSLAPKVLPEDLEGRRALDVGTFDGFWAFEMERRGAEVLALDLPAFEASDWPPANRIEIELSLTDLDLKLGRGFELAAGALSSAARRVESDVYDLGPELTGGPVDFVFVGAILLHLRDPVRALEQVLSTLRPRGSVCLLEPVSRAWRKGPAAEFRALSTSFVWWYPNPAALLAWVEAAGFADARRRGLHRPSAVANRDMRRERLCHVTATRPGS